MRALLNSSLLLLVFVTVTFFILNDNVFGVNQYAATQTETPKLEDLIDESHTSLRENQERIADLMSRLRGTFR